MRKKRVVIYDDDISVLNVMNDIFSVRNYEVIRHSAPKICPIYDDNYEVCPQEYPCADILISDLNMDQMDGLKMLLSQSKIGCKIDKRNKAIISGNLDDMNMSICIENGIKFFRKPFDFEAFSGWIEQCEKHMNILVPLECRRTETRTVFHKEIVFVTGIDTKSRGFLINLSNSGFCIKVQKPLFVNQIIKIKSGIPVDCKIAMVRWVDRSKDNSYMAGVLCR